MTTNGHSPQYEGPSEETVASNGHGYFEGITLESEDDHPERYLGRGRFFKRTVSLQEYHDGSDSVKEEFPEGGQNDTAKVVYNTFGNSFYGAKGKDKIDAIDFTREVVGERKKIRLSSFPDLVKTIGRVIFHMAQTGLVEMGD